ncbi:hypothetical protein ABTY59_31440 [Streptomyces sp. NPDC096079]|uniref:hypothetical protein n=1 Tax=unclassified Streptomyces TaxID=2593676 RepID=UPI0033312343
MTVQVTMHTSAMPEGSPAARRTVTYEDHDGAKFVYSVIAGGALRIGTNGEAQPEVVYGPSAWESVQGDAAS